jgi:dephospho-CoA kinase
MTPANAAPRVKRPFKAYGLTGGMGSGKTTVAQLFVEQGVPFLDADQVARQLREPGQPAFLAIQNRFGTTQRQKLRELLSRDPQAKRDLEAILHPLIQTESEKALALLADHHPDAEFVLYEASLLIEAGRAEDFDGLIVVTAPLEERINRIMGRDQCTRDAALAMIQAQLSDEERLKSATYSISNHGSLLDLQKAVKKVLDQIKQA